MSYNFDTLALHAGQPQVDAGLAEVDRLELRVAVGHVQQRDVAEARQLVERCFGRSRIGLGVAGQPHAGDAGRAQHLQELALAQTHDKCRLMFG